LLQPSRYALPILKTFVPHTEQVPVVAGLPFFIVVAVGFLISLFALHFTQYASITQIPFFQYSVVFDCSYHRPTQASSPREATTL
jgi:hypothetical protein